MNQRLQEIDNLLPFFNEISGASPIIALWDTDGRLISVYNKATIPMPFKPDDVLHDKNDQLFEAIRTRKQIHNKLPKEVFGVPFEGVITPIFDGNEVVGVITYSYSTELQNNIYDCTENLEQTLTTTASSIQDITSGVVNLSDYINQIHGISNDIQNELTNAIQIINSIQKNANYSNILALNASIESARVGAAGRGFAVVSNEMRNFAKQSSDAAKSINEALTTIINSLNNIRSAINESSAIAEEQSVAAETINSTFKDITSLSSKIVEMCAQIK